MTQNQSEAPKFTLPAHAYFNEKTVMNGKVIHDVTRLKKLPNKSEALDKWKWVSKNKLVHIHCDDVEEVNQILQKGKNNFKDKN